jgi:excinuclease ABC subunit C
VLCPRVDEVQRFDGFGPSVLASDTEPAAVEWVPPADLRSSRRVIRQRVTAAPGVYGMVNAEGELIYVGKSKRLRDRLLTYFSSNAAPSKARRIIRQTKRVLWERAPTELAALVRELELIRRFEPRYNVQGQPGRLRPAYIALGRGPAPYVYVTTKPSPRDGMAFGPVRGVRLHRRVARLVNNGFQLRDCPATRRIRFADQLELFDRERPPRCHRREFGMCLAPCAAGCSRGEYAERVRAARDFLQGRDVSLLDELEAGMRSAAARRQFEIAANLRDAREALVQLDRRLGRLREARRRYTFVYPMPGYGGGESWCLVRGGHLIAACKAPRGRRSAQECLALVEGVYSANGRDGCDGRPEDLDMLQLVGSWFDEHPEEYRRTLAPDRAAAICRAKACDFVADPL